MGYRPNEISSRIRLLLSVAVGYGKQIPVYSHAPIGIDKAFCCSLQGDILKARFHARLT